jgi:hypothetical protein
MENISWTERVKHEEELLHRDMEAMNNVIQ